MEDKCQSAIIELVSIYAHIDLLAMEACAKRMLSEEGREAKLDMALQVEEERRHYLLQRERLAEVGVPMEDKIPAGVYGKVRDELAEMDRFDFLASLQLAIEGVGIAAVEKVYEKADARTRQALDLPIDEEKRQTDYAIEQIEGMLATASPEDKSKLQRRIFHNMLNMREHLRSLLIPFDKLWENVGLSSQEIGEACHHRAQDICNRLGFSFDEQADAA